MNEAVAAVLGAGLLLGGAGAAWADPSSVSGGTESISLASGGTTSQSLDFNQFSTSLGTLDEIDVQLSGSMIGGGSEANLTGGEGGSASASFTATLNISGPGPETLFSGSVSASASCSRANMNTAVPCDSGLIAPTLASGGLSPNPTSVTGSFSPFEGSGSVDLAAALENFDPTNMCDPYYPSGGTDCNNTNSLTWLGNVTLTYLYTPETQNSVPEPSAIALMATGLSGLGFSLRRRRR